jgi:hypothetical protein
VSAIFELDDSGWDRMVADARNGNMATEQDFQPGFTQGTLRGLGSGLMRGAVNTMDFLNTGVDASSAPEYYDYDPAPKGLDPEAQKERVQGLEEESRKKSLDFWTPDSTSVGVLGRVLGGLGETAAPLIAGMGNPAVLAGTQTLAAGKRLVDEGVDSTTAGVTAAAEGLSTYAGFKLPILGKTLGQRVFTGMGGNLAVGMGGTFAEQKILEGRGYDELAQQYDPFDPEGRTIDLLMGAAFGGITHVGARMAASDRDAVLAAANARHFQVDSAPGRPLDAHAAAAHVEAMKTAFDQMERGEPVSVPQDVLEANFEPRPAREAAGSGSDSRIDRRHPGARSAAHWRGDEPDRRQAARKADQRARAADRHR